MDYDKDNPNRDPNLRPIDRSNNSMSWIVGAVVALAVIAAIFMFNRRTDNVALNNGTTTPMATNSRPATPVTPNASSTEPSTTGSSTNGSGSNAR